MDTDEFDDEIDDVSDTEAELARQIAEDEALDYDAGVKERPKPKLPATRKKAPAKVDPEVAELIWAAGIFCGGGSLKLIKSANTLVVRYMLTSSMYPEALIRFSRIMGSNVSYVNVANVSKTSGRVTTQGAALHAFMTRIWPYITRERKQQYAELRKLITPTLEGPNPYR